MNNIQATLDFTQESAARRAGKEAGGVFPARRAGVAGLSKLHNRTSEPSLVNAPSRLTWFPGASMIDIEVPSVHIPKREKKQKPRGRIREWSMSSRGRLKLLLDTFKREELGRAMVVTLTYPAEFPAPDDHAVYKRHLHTFTVALRRRWPLCSGIWKLEFQSRGAAHYHLMLFGLRDENLETLREWTRETWYRIAHNGDKHLGAAATQVDPILSVGGSMNYFAKYMSKGDQTMPGNFSGRYWGKINEQRLPHAEQKNIEVPRNIAVKIRRIARKKMAADVNSSRWKRFLHPYNDSMRGQIGIVGGRLEWERLKSVYHSGGKGFRYMKKARYFDEERGKYSRHECWAEVSISVSMFRHYKRMENFGYPKKFRTRNNDRVRLLCDASAFMAKLHRWSAPASSFLEFSRVQRA